MVISFLKYDFGVLVQLIKIKLHMHPNPASSSHAVSVTTFTAARSEHIGAVVLAVAMVVSLASFNAQALGFGRITVQSTLGEPLRAEVDIVEINAQETASLQTRVASPEAFKAAGIDYSAAVSGLSISLQRRPDGKSFLQLTGDRPVNEPFVDLLLEADSSSGRMVRDYTMLLDPPGMRSNAAAAALVTTSPMTPRSVTARAPVVSQASAQPKVPATLQPAPRPQRAPAEAARTSAEPKEAAPRGAPDGNSVAPKDSQITVRAGDTAGKLAAQVKSSNVSLDQMLVALLRENPDAFVSGNVNRMKSGAVLQIPAADVISAVSPAQASQTIIAQSGDFNAFRRKLAASVPTTTAVNTDRQASGRVQAKVEDRAPASAIADKLTLSKGAVSGAPAASAEEKIVKTRQSNDSASRVAELSKNINDLNKLGAASATSSSAPRASAPAGVLVPAPAGVARPLPVASAAVPMVAAASAPVVAAAAGVAALASAPTSLAASAAAAVSPGAALTSSPASASSAPAMGAPAVASTLEVASSPAAAVSVPAVKPQLSVAPVAPEPSFFDALLSSAMGLPGLGLLIAGLGGFAFYRYRQNKKSAPVDSSFLESRLQPDSFFGASGGERVDTNDGNATGSSLAYSPSQLDVAGDVDPVAEADVYLAYGRDLQAEEILKEALRTNPARVTVLAKLLEIYAKRHDAKAFSAIAADAFTLTRGEGSEWKYIADMGRELDPNNAMYQPGGKPPAKAAVSAATAAAASSGGFGSSTLPRAIDPQHAEPSDAVDFDLDLGFSMGDTPTATTAKLSSTPSLSPAAAALSARAAPTVAAPAPAVGGVDMDVDNSNALDLTRREPARSAARSDEPMAFESMEFVEQPSFKLPSTASSRPKADMSAAANEPLEFDLGALSLDLDESVNDSAPPVSASADTALDDPLETKFSLAKEFSSLGDPDGARALAQEVLLQAQGPLKVRAQAFLNALS